MYFVLFITQIIKPNLRYSIKSFSLFLNKHCTLTAERDNYVLASQLLSSIHLFSCLDTNSSFYSVYFS